MVTNHHIKAVFSGLLWALCLSMLTGCASKRSRVEQQPPCATVAAGHRAVIPVSRAGRAGWMDRHELIVDRIKTSQVDLLFIGDSITQRWERQGKQAWETYFAPLNAVNAGIDGDCTEHVLWRIDNGTIDGISPKVVLLLIGSNHVNDYAAEEIVDGIKAIACRIKEKLPDSQLLILGILPRGTASSAGTYRLAKASEGASKIADHRSVHYLDVGERFFDGNGNVSDKLMTADKVHLSEAGYNLLAQLLQPVVAGLMNK